MRWPDVALPWLPTIGADIVGRVPTFGVFRSAKAADTDGLTDLMARASSTVDDIVKRARPTMEQVEAVFEKTEAERKLGLLNGYFSREELDCRYGPNDWIALPRFATWQAAKGAWRVIDNGKPVHNQMTQLDERIHTTAHSVSFAIPLFVEELVMDGQL